jgi:hypothetical protein
MVRAAPTLVLAVSFAGIAVFACGSEDERKDGADGIADAFHQIAEHECHCVAEASGLGSHVEDACREHIGDIEDFFPAACIEAVIDRHPEARPAYECAAEVTYDYVDCIVGEGCPEPFQCADGSEISGGERCDGYEDCPGGDDEPADCSAGCDAILQSAAIDCPQPPEAIGPEIEACFGRAAMNGNASSRPDATRTSGLR